jgi:beta-glucanase (GH16 family)
MALFFKQVLPDTFGSGTSFGQAFPSNTSAGSLLLICLSSIGATSPSVTDSHGNTYTQIAAAPSNTRVLFYAINKKGGALTVTVNQTNSVTLGSFGAEYTGAQITSTIDAISPTSTSVTSSPASLPLTTTAANEQLILIGRNNNAGTLAFTDGSTARAFASANVFLGDRFVSASGGQTGTFTVTGTVSCDTFYLSVRTLPLFTSAGGPANLDRNAWFIPEGTALGTAANGVTPGAGMSFIDSPGGAVSAGAVDVSGSMLNLRAFYQPQLFPMGVNENGPAPLPLTVGVVMWRNMQVLYGTVEVRAKLAGVGTHSAIYMIGSNGQQTSYVQQPNVVNFPKGAEIDMVESFPSIDSGVMTTVHLGLFDETGGHTATPVTGITDYSQNFHIYKIVWLPGSMQFFIDGVQQGATITTNVPSKPMFLIIDAEEADSASGEVDSANYPSGIQVDYVNVHDQFGTQVFFDDFTGASAFQTLSASNLTFIQGTSNATFSGTTVAKAYASNTTGSSLLLAFTQFNAVTGSAAVTDTLGNTWAQIGTPTIIGGNTVQLWQVPVNKAPGGANTVTSTAPVSNGFNVLGILEYTNQAATPIDVVSAWASGTGTTATTPSITTNFTNETLVVFGVNGDGLTSTAGAGFTLRVSGGTNQVVAEDEAQLNPGAYAGTWTQTNANWKTAILAVKSTASVVISGNVAGVANVVVTYTGAASGFAISDALGNYSIAGIPNGAYTVTPSLSGVNFSPASQNVTISAAPAVVNFTLAGGVVPGPTDTELHITYIEIQTTAVINDPDNRRGSSTAIIPNQSTPFTVTSGTIHGRFDTFTVLNNPA